ncbi:PREDICTED: 3,9-dihydroxypterocarpan 6A-monooxygenase [Tarenaya hassleriana]|uniref:3,9-dihydroxypterocarpan 6A-monooxygenase n=1 Tax=Tarenaya hassleriana TaxID=28532 RepID=UPI00053C6187|nr:PREDICTED: 3,9-dihydroxypterocarpan 6A-monooxygenase [Tarenaya hassleriana]
MMIDLQYYFIPFLLWLGLTVLFQAITSKFRNKRPLPPSPPALPIIGHMHLLGPIAHQSLHKLATRYGPLIYLFIGSIPNLIVSTLDMGKEVLKDNEFNFLNRPTMANVDYLTYGSADFFSAPYGSHWRFMKKICMMELFSNQTLESFVPLRREDLRKFLMFLLKKAEEGESVNLGNRLKILTNNVVTRMMFRGRHPNRESEREEVVKVVTELNELAGFLNLSETFWFLKKLDIQGLRKRLKEARDKYDAIIERIMEEHEDARRKIKETGSGSDAGVKNMLDILLDVYEDEHAEMKLTRENIKGLIMNIYGGGTDTSANTVEWAIAELINHPEIMKKAQREVDEVVGKNRVVEEKDVCKLTYLQAIVKETLRLHPGGIFVREAAEECVVAGHRIPARTRIIVNLWAIGRDPNQWEDPFEFKPERFHGTEWNVLGDKTMMFGSGRRSCPGEKMALRFVPTVLAALIQCFELGVDGAVNMEEGPGFTIPRAKPLVCVPMARLQPFPHEN